MSVMIEEQSKLGVVLQEILIKLDEQMALWSALHDHAGEYLSAIFKSEERQGEMRQPSALGIAAQMHNLRTLSDTDHDRTVQVLYRAFQSTLIKSHQSLKRMDQLMEEAKEKTQAAPPHERIQPQISHYMNLFATVCRAYRCEYVSRLLGMIRRFI